MRSYFDVVKRLSLYRQMMTSTKGRMDAPISEKLRSGLFVSSALMEDCVSGSRTWEDDQYLELLWELYELLDTMIRFLLKEEAAL